MTKAFLNPIMSGDPLLFVPLQPHEFQELPAGFEYRHEISEGSNTTAFNTGVDTRDLRRCVVCGKSAFKVGSGPLGVQRAHIIGRTEDNTVGDFFIVSQSFPIAS
jgi:hypothetical protein